MADGGISETAIAAGVAAAAESAAAAEAAAALAAAGTTAATVGEAAGAGAALAGTAAEAAPVIAAAAPEAFTAAAVPEVTAAAAPAITEAPFLGATASEPALLGPSVAAPEVVAPATTAPSGILGAAPTTATTTTAPTTGLHSAAWAGGTGQFAPATAPGVVAPTAPTTVAPEGLHSAAWTNSTGQFAPASSPYSPGLLDQAGQWWQTASVGDKLEAGGKLLSGVGTAGSAASAAKGPPAKGPTHTIQPGSVGKPSGGEQQLAAIVEAMLKRRDAYQSGVGGGAPIAYRPRGLLG